MLITVFTPTYNRKTFLPILYDSLQKQTFQDFEWVIVDDGSSDNTIEYVKNIILQNKESKSSFTIRYYYQNNGGKHRAINHGVQKAKGELFFIVDSDDYLVDNSLEIIANTYFTIKNDKSFAGLGGLLMHSNGTIIGNMPIHSPLDCSQVDYWCKYRIHGDKTEVFRTDVLRDIPFPVYEGEKFCPEELEWLRISKKYQLRYINEVLAVRDYLEGGLTSKIVKLRMNNPRASIYDYSYFNTFSIPFSRKVRNAVNYWRFRFCLPKDYRKRYIIPHLKWYWNWVMPLGWFFHLKDTKNVI